MVHPRYDGIVHDNQCCAFSTYIFSSSLIVS